MDSPDWYTPAPIVEAARDVMGTIDLDPASDAIANEVVRATRYFTEDDRSLKQSWIGNVFLNPPGGLVRPFWRHLMAEVEIKNVTQVIWIGYSLEQLQTLQDKDELDAPTPLLFPMCVPSRRIAFVENDAKRAARIERLQTLGKKANLKSTPSHANYITYLGPYTARFARIFGAFGQVRL